MHLNPIVNRKTLVLPPAPLPWQQGLWASLWRAHQNDTLAHALLISGPQGLGKLHFAVGLAKSLLCLATHTTTHNFLESMPCNQCKSCRCFEANAHPNYRLLQPESPSHVISIDQIRKCITALQHTVQHDKTSTKTYKIVLINPADTLQTAASHALLKTLEEPPTASLFILISEKPTGLMPTIRSRCQPLRLTPPPRETTPAWLQQYTHCDATHIDLALSLAGETPLQALKLIETDALVYYDMIWDTFSDLRVTHKNPSIVAEQWSQMPRELLFDYLLYFISTLIQYKAGVSLQQAHLKQRSTILASLAEANSFPFLYRYLDSLQSIRRNITTQSLNLLLSLETLAHQWSQPDIENL